MSKALSARQKDEAGQVAQGIDQGDDLGRQSAAGAPDRLSVSPAFCAGSMLVDPDDRAIDDGVFKVGVARQHGEDVVEDALLRPAAEPPPN